MPRGEHDRQLGRGQPVGREPPSSTIGRDVGCKGTSSEDAKAVGLNLLLNHSLNQSINHSLIHSTCTLIRTHTHIDHTFTHALTYTCDIKTPIILTRTRNCDLFSEHTCSPWCSTLQTREWLGHVQPFTAADAV